MFSLLVFAIIALVSLVTTSPIAERTASYDVTVPTFIVSHQGQEIKLRGTIQEVVDQMEARHPGYSADLTARMNENLSNRAELEPRNKILPPTCMPVPGQSWTYADAGDIMTSVNVLVASSVAISEAAGPGSCSRISCYGSSAIIYCNDVS
jgi:hypothetical protein